MEPAATLEEATIAAILVAALVFSMYSQPYLSLGLIAGAIMGIITLIMMRKSKVQRVRRLMLIGLSIVMWVGFLVILMSEFGSISAWVTLHKRTDFIPVGPRLEGYTVIPCPLTMPQVIYGYSYGGSVVGAKVILQWSAVGFLMAAVVYITVALLFGKGWCGWMCPFGATAEAFMTGRRKWTLSRLMKRVTTKTGEIVPGGLRDEVRDIAYGVAIAVILLAAWYWIQPFCVMCWAGLASWIVFPVNTLAITTLFLTFFIILPFMTKTRWCHVICPIGVGVGLLGTASPFTVKIDKAKCNLCYDCLYACPTHAITPKTIEDTGKPNFDCNKCGRCIEACPEDAIDIRAQGSSKRARSWFLPLTMAITTTWYIWFVVTTVQLLPRLLRF